YSGLFFFQAEDGIRDDLVTGVQTCLFRSPLEAGSGITMGNITYTSNATALSIKPPGILAVDRDAAGYPLSVAPGSAVASGGLTLSVDKTGAFNASVTAAGTYTFTYKAQNSQAKVST